MPKASKIDPTKDPEFQGVIRHFLKTKPQPFTPKAKPKSSRAAPATAKPKKQG